MEIIDEYMDFFFDRIIELRRQLEEQEGRQISKREVSRSIGQSEGYMDQIESKKSYPSYTAFLYLCEYYKITPGEFFDRSMEYPILVREIIEDIKIMTPEQLKAVKNITSEISKLESAMKNNNVKDE